MSKVFVIPDVHGTPFGESRFVRVDTEMMEFGYADGE